MPARPETDDDGYLELPEEDNESIDTGMQVQRAQEQLLALKRQQEQVEKQKRELEELGRRQEELQQGRVEMTERLTRALVVVERETVDAQKRVELLQAIDDSYRKHLLNLERINSKSWEPTQVNKELSKALSAVEDARAEYNKSRPKISVEVPEGGEVSGGNGLSYEYESGVEKNFLYWLKSGAAFTLPLIFVLIVLFMALIAFFTPA